MTSSLKRTITTKFKRLGLSLQKKALDKIIELSLETNNNERDNFVIMIGEECLKLKTNSNILSLDDITRAIEVVTCSYNNENEDEQLSVDILEITDAFSMSKYKYDSIRKLFEIKKISSLNFDVLHSKANTKTQIFRDRYELILQRILRHKIFSKLSIKNNNNNNSNNNSNVNSITCISSLLGSSGERWVFGMLCELEEGKIYLQDLTSYIEIDVSTSELSGGLFTWNSYVLAQGHVLKNNNNIFKVTGLGSPPFERRIDTLKNYSNLNNIQTNSYNTIKKLKEIEEKSTDEMFVILSDIFLDDNNVILWLNKLFSGYSNINIPPSLFIFIGNFTKTRIGNNEKDIKYLKLLFNKLNDIIIKYPILCKESQFIFIPGPNDPSIGNVLPRPSLLPSLTSKLRNNNKINTFFTTNPCRLRFCTQEIVIFRDNLFSKMRRYSVVLPNINENESNIMSKHFISTLLDQSHLCPLPLINIPINWNFDHSLRLYPAPHVLIVADRHEEFEYNYKGVKCICPSQFGISSGFVCYFPHNKEVDFSKIKD